MSDSHCSTYQQIIALFSERQLDPADGSAGEGLLRDEKLPEFDTVLRLFHKRIYNLTYRLIGDTEEASDLTQETFVKAFKAYRSFRGKGEAVFPWLCRIAVNSCRNRFRQVGRTRQYEAFSLDDPVDHEDGCVSEMEFPDQSADPVKILQQSELGSKIHEAVQSLPPEFRIVVVLRDMQGLSYKEIADVTELSLEAVKARLFRGRAGLRRRLSAYLEE